MSTLSHAGRGSLLALGCVVGLGLGLPALSRVLSWLGLGGDTLIRRLLGYELALAALGLATAALVCALVPGHTPGPLAIGTLSAPVAKVSWLGLGTSAGATWRRELVPMTFVITAVTATFVYFASRATFSWERALACAPWVLLFAALNAAGEEWLYRVALLRAADGVTGAAPACLLSAVVFGVAHLGGMPGGLSGALAAGVLGFVLSRSALETGGVAAAWLVHFLQDVVIFGGWLGASQAAEPLTS